MVMIKHDKCAPFEAEIAKLKKEREEMKEALIDFEYCWKNPKDSDYSYYVNSKYQKLIENLKGEK
jgi:hypothetical protein